MPAQLTDGGFELSASWSYSDGASRVTSVSPLHNETVGPAAGSHFAACTGTYTNTGSGYALTGTITQTFTVAPADAGYYALALSMIYGPIGVWSPSGTWPPADQYVAVTLNGVLWGERDSGWFQPWSEPWHSEALPSVFLPAGVYTITLRSYLSNFNPNPTLFPTQSTGQTNTMCLDALSLVPQSSGDYLPFPSPCPKDSYQSLVLLDRPIVYWPLDDAGPTFADLGPSDITLQQAGGTVTPQAHPGPFSGASSAGFGGSPDSTAPYSYAGYLVGNGSPDLGFYNSSGNIVSTSIPFVNLRGPLSLEAWLLPLAGDPVAPSSQAWFGWGDPDGGPGTGFGSGITAQQGFASSQDSLVYYSYQWNTWSLPDGRRATVVDQASTTYRNQWFHVVLTVSRSGQGAIYVNGVQQPLATNNPWVFTFPPGNSAQTNPYQETAWFTLGSLNLAGTTWPNTGGVSPPATGWQRGWRGGLAHVALYNYALSACQVQSHYQTTVACTASGPADPCASTTYHSTVLALEPSVYLPLEETSGSSYSDASGGGHAATTTDLGVIAGGRPGPLCGTQAMKMVSPSASGTSTGHYVVLDNPASVPTGAVWTYSFWVCFDPQDFDVNYAQWRVEPGAFGFSMDFQITAFCDAGDGVYLVVNNLASADVLISTEFTNNVFDWHFWCVTWDGTTVTVYHNGAPDQDATIPGALTYGAPGTVYLSGAMSPGVSQAIAQAAIFPSTLSASQVAALYAAGKCCAKSYNDLVLCDGPESYWPLDGAGSTPYVDLGPNHNDLHEQQLSVSVPPPPALTHNSTGPIGGQGSITFNGTTWLENSALSGVFYDVDTTGLYQDRGGQNVFCSMTFECWFKLPTPTSWTNFICIELMPNSFTNSTFGFFPSTGPGGYSAGEGQLILSNAFSLVASQTTAITPGAWHHFVITYDWSNSLHFIPGPFQWQYPNFYTTGTACYLDGVLIPQDRGPWFTDRWNNPEGWPGDAFFDWWSRADVVRLGAGYGDGYGYPYPGYNPRPDVVNGMSLAGVALYNYALSACQVLSHYEKATTGGYMPCSPCCVPVRTRRPFRQIHVPT